MTTRFAAVAWYVLLQLALVSLLQAQTILYMPSSPEAIGRGGMYFSTNTDDPLAPMSNPGLLGFQVERNHLTVGFYPSKVSWLPYDSYYNDLELFYGYSGRAVSFGIDRSTMSRLLHSKNRFSLGLGYQETAYSYSYYRYFYSNNSRSEAKEKVKTINIGLGYHGEFLQAGIGMNVKTVDVNWFDNKTKFSANDFGLVLQSHLERAFWNNDSARDWKPFITPLIGYTLSNVGGQFRYDGSDNGQPLPRKYALSLNLSTGLKSQVFGKGDLDVIAVAVGEQIGDNLIEDNYRERMQLFNNPQDHQRNYYHKNPFGNLQPLNDFVLGKPHPWVSRQQGIEIALLETGYLRWGHVSTSYNYTYSYYSSEGGHYSAGFYVREKYSTNGFGLRLSGLLKILTAKQEVSKSSVISFLTHHLDLQYQYAIRHDDAGWQTDQDGTSFHEVAVLLR
jgi:hypothetical protein